VARRVAMGRLVHGDGKQHRQGVDQNGLDEIGGVHPRIVSDRLPPGGPAGGGLGDCGLYVRQMHALLRDHWWLRRLQGMLL